MSKLVMVINDSAEILTLFEQLLTGEGYEVSLHSYNPQDIDSVKKVKPDLIISDHLITKEDLGWQFLQKLKMTPQTAKIPIIICTTSMNTVRDADGRFAEKGIIVIPKPFDIEELFAAVEQMIGKANEPGLGTTSINRMVALTKHKNK